MNRYRITGSVLYKLSENSTENFFNGTISEYTDLSIGSIIHTGSAELHVTEQSYGCKGCFFHKNNDCRFVTFPNEFPKLFCNLNERADRTPVIFKNVVKNAVFRTCNVCGSLVPAKKNPDIKTGEFVCDPCFGITGLSGDYMLINPHGHTIPKKRHLTLSEAEKEAERLLNKDASEILIVKVVKTARKKVVVEWR